MPMPGFSPGSNQYRTRYRRRDHRTTEAHHQSPLAGPACGHDLGRCVGRLRSRRHRAPPSQARSPPHAGTTATLEPTTTPDRGLTLPAPARLLRISSPTPSRSTTARRIGTLVVVVTNLAREMVPELVLRWPTAVRDNIFLSPFAPPQGSSASVKAIQLVQDWTKWVDLGEQGEPAAQSKKGGAAVAGGMLTIVRSWPPVWLQGPLTFDFQILAGEAALTSQGSPTSSEGDCAVMRAILPARARLDAVARSVGRDHRSGAQGVGRPRADHSPGRQAIADGGPASATTRCRRHTGRTTSSRTPPCLTWRGSVERRASAKSAHRRAGSTGCRWVDEAVDIVLCGLIDRTMLRCRRSRSSSVCCALEAAWWWSDTADATGGEPPCTRVCSARPRGHPARYKLVAAARDSRSRWSTVASTSRIRPPPWSPAASVKARTR